MTSFTDDPLVQFCRTRTFHSNRLDQKSFNWFEGDCEDETTKCLNERTCSHPYLYDATVAKVLEKYFIIFEVASGGNPMKELW